MTNGHTSLQVALTSLLASANLIAEGQCFMSDDQREEIRSIGSNELTLERISQTVVPVRQDTAILGDTRSHSGEMRYPGPRIKNACDSPMASVDKALRSLLYLGNTNSKGATLSNLALELGMNKTSLHLTLSALRHRDFVEQDADGSYKLGPALISLADKYVRELSLRNDLHQALDNLSLAVKEVCNFGVLSGKQVVFLDKVGPPHAPQVLAFSGLRKPALESAIGRAILCKMFLDYTTFANRFSNEFSVGQAGFAGNSLSQVWKNLLEAHKRGFAFQEHYDEARVACIAVAVMRGAEPVGAISIKTTVDRVRADNVDSFVSKIHDSVARHLPAGYSLQRGI